MADIGTLAADIEREVIRLVAEKRALETKINALRLTEAEITARVGDHMKNLQVKKRLEELQKAAITFAESEA